MRFAGTRFVTGVSAIAWFFALLHLPISVFLNVGPITFYCMKNSPTRLTSSKLLGHERIKARCGSPNYMCFVSRSIGWRPRLGTFWRDPFMGFTKASAKKNYSWCGVLKYLLLRAVLDRIVHTLPGFLLRCYLARCPTCTENRNMAAAATTYAFLSFNTFPQLLYATAYLRHQVGCSPIPHIQFVRDLRSVYSGVVSSLKKWVLIWNDDPTAQLWVLRLLI